MSAKSFSGFSARLQLLSFPAVSQVLLGPSTAGRSSVWLQHSSLQQTSTNPRYSSSFWAIVLCISCWCQNGSHKFKVKIHEQRIVWITLSSGICVYTHTHTHAYCGTGPAAGRDVQIYLVCKLLGPPLFHWLYQGVSIIWTSGLSRFVSDTFFSQQVRVGLKIILDRTVQRIKLVLHGPEGEQCGADHKVFFAVISKILDYLLK